MSLPAMSLCWGTFSCWMPLYQFWALSQGNLSHFYSSGSLDGPILESPDVGASPELSGIHLCTLLTRFRGLIGPSFHYRVKSPLKTPISEVIGKTTEGILQDLDWFEINAVHLLCGPEYFQLHLGYHNEKKLNRRIFYISQGKIFLAEAPRCSWVVWSN